MFAQRNLATVYDNLKGEHLSTYCVPQELQFPFKEFSGYTWHAAMPWPGLHICKWGEQPRALHAPRSGHSSMKCTLQIRAYHPKPLSCRIRTMNLQEGQGTVSVGQQFQRFLFLLINQSSCAKTHHNIANASIKMVSVCPFVYSGDGYLSYLGGSLHRG